MADASVLCYVKNNILSEAENSRFNLSSKTHRWRNLKQQLYVSISSESRDASNAIIKTAMAWSKPRIVRSRAVAEYEY
jgi:hypothetical protein